MGKKPELDERTRGISKWFESKLSLQLVGVDKHQIVEGIQRQMDIAEGNVEGYDVANKLDSMKIHTLIYCGSEDAVIDTKSAQLLQRKIGEEYASLEVMDGGGHNFWFERTDEFVETIEEWM